MKVLVTGGLGSIGRTTVARLMRHGHEATIIDRAPREEVPEAAWAQVDGARYHQADITDFDAIAPLFDGMDAVIHLAAFAHPGAAGEVEIFHTNVGGSFNVYRAAADAGVKRVVSASSINALGYNYGIKGFPIEYFPIDEDHPTYTTDPYSFSKQMLEEIAAYFWRREGISGVQLRLPAVIDPDSHWAPRMRKYFSHRQAAYEALRALPPAERRARIDAVIEESEALRAKRLAEIPWEERRKEFEKRHRNHAEMPPAERILWFGRDDFWSIIHVEDAAQALEKGVLADYEGSHPLFVADEENAVGVPSCDLAEYFFPDVTEWACDVNGTTSLVSTARAEALLGFETEHSMLAWLAEGESED